MLALKHENKMSTSTYLYSVAEKSKGCLVNIFVCTNNSMVFHLL